ncbi:rRNA (cytosine-C(5))-methyltransferase NOP2C isoform X2 [Mercurialis annua]|uniref:rRNA (cytosine-C(5))-methyltransferase NOP2C isoform X2 n=1 Tax=Mercurialis annua TaxID=3986 RepID=UPI00215E3366|nr:rRNA (cytosine-C(5))-methyltransferase NOP2C isoform X2 [Mercurialis annua]
MKKGRALLNKTIIIRRAFFSTSSSFSSQPQQSLFDSFLQMDPSDSDRYSFNPKLQWNPQVQDYFSKAYGPEQFSHISHALTRPPSYSCVRVNTLKTTTDAVVKKLMAIVGFEDGSDGSCKHFEDNVQANPISKCEIPGMDYVLFVKGSGPHKVDYGFVPGSPPPKEVIVSRKCAEAVLRGAQVFVPGVLACSAHVEEGDAVAVSVAIEQHSPDGGWAVGMTRGTVLQGLPTDPHYSERNGLYIGQGTTTMSRAGLFRVLKGIAVDMSNRVFKLPSFHDVLEGEIFLQNFPSIVTAHALDPQKGERVLDMCAAPGGKTTAIALLMKNEGEVIACDRSHNKVLDIQKVAAEMSLTCITTYKLDALKAVRRVQEHDEIVTIQSAEPISIQEEKTSSADQECNSYKACNGSVSIEKENERTYVSKADIRKERRRMKNGPGRNQCVGGRVDNSKGFDPDSFDRVLLDAPCSALGLRPRLFAGEDTIKSLRNQAVYQRRMFDQAVKLVRPGGVIVYSTLCHLGI